MTRRGGFTLVELLIVIVVIAILAAISVVAYNGIQQRSRAVTVVDTLAKIEKGFILERTAAGESTWPLEASYSAGSNPNINTIIANTDLKNYLQTLDPISGFAGSTYIYDNDGDNDDFDDCGQDLDGINIRITGTNIQLAQSVDDQMDDGNLACGQLRWYPYGGGMIKYMLSETQSL